MFKVEYQEEKMPFGYLVTNGESVYSCCITQGVAQNIGDVLNERIKLGLSI